MHTHKHRHFVVLPLALAMLGAGATALYGGASTASVIAEENATVCRGEYSVWRSPGTSYVDCSKSEVAPPEGDYLVQSHGSVDIALPTLHVRAAQAAFTLSVHGRTVSVAALTGPVLLMDKNTTLLLPIGRQWRGELLANAQPMTEEWWTAHETSPLPLGFLREQLLLLEGFPEPAGGSATTILEAASRYVPGALPVARQRGERSVIERLETQLAAKNAPAAEVLLQSLSGNAAVPHLAKLLSHAHESAVQIPLVHWLSQRDAQLWLLLALDPAVSASAWTYGEPSLTKEELLSVLHTFPKTAFAENEHNPLAVEGWGKRLQALLDAEPNPVPMVEQYAPRLTRTVRYLREQGYPERSRVLAQTAFGVFQPYFQQVNEAVEADLKELRSLQEAPAHIAMPASVPTAVPVAQAEVQELTQTKQVEVQARTVLKEVEFPDSSNVKITPLSKTTVRVRYGGSLEFTLDLTSNQVTDIVYKQTRTPYPLSLNAFTDWVKKL